MTLETENVGRLQIWAESFEQKTADFAAWTVDNSGITRIISRENLIDCNESEAAPTVQTAAQKAKKIAVAVLTGFALLIPAIIGFSAHQITTGLNKAWEFVVGKSIRHVDEPDSDSEYSSKSFDVVSGPSDDAEKADQSHSEYDNPVSHVQSVASQRREEAGPKSPPLGNGQQVFEETNQQNESENAEVTNPQEEQLNRELDHLLDQALEAPIPTSRVDQSNP